MSGEAAAAELAISGSARIQVHNVKFKAAFSCKARQRQFEAGKKNAAMPTPEDIWPCGHPPEDRLCGVSQLGGKQTTTNHLEVLDGSFRLGATGRVVRSVQQVTTNVTSQRLTGGRLVTASPLPRMPRF